MFDYIIFAIDYFMQHEWIQALILGFGFSYAVGVIFLPLIVQDVLRDAISNKWTLRIWKCQFYPVINFVLFISFFITLLGMLLWFIVRALVWQPIHKEPYEKYYKNIYVPEKYKLPKKFRKDDNKEVM